VLRWATIIEPPAHAPKKSTTQLPQRRSLYASGIDYLDVADHLWLVLGPLMRGHAAIYRATGGRIGSRLPGLPSLLLLGHVGAKSGKQRSTPLVYMPDRETCSSLPRRAATQGILGGCTTFARTQTPKSKLREPA
jgi:hypothetical protein